MTAIESVRRAWRPEWSRWLAFIAIALGIALSVFALSVQSWTMSDGLEYREAAERLRDGRPLYVPAEIGEKSYRYAPWFAFVWMVVPFPDALWIGAMTVCAVVAVIPVARTGWFGIALAAVVFPYLLIAAMGGHVQPALIAALAWGIGTRWGPVVIAMVASLKLTPILFILVYLGRRQWPHAIVTAALTALLLAPILLFDLTYFPTETTGSWGLFEWSPIVWFVLAAGLAGYTLVRPSWSAASLLVTLAIPKFVYYDVSYLVVGRYADARSEATAETAEAMRQAEVPPASRPESRPT